MVDKDIKKTIGIMKISDKLGASASLNEIISFEIKYNFKLPDDYRNFLKNFNGGRPEKNYRVFTYYKQDGSKSNSLVDWFNGLIDGLHYSLEEDIDIYEGRIPEDMLPIASDPFGNLVLLGVGANNGIWFWDHEIEPFDTGSDGIYKVTDNFESFVNMLTPLV